jgi:hypothetical protein
MTAGAWWTEQSARSCRSHAFRDGFDGESRADGQRRSAAFAGRALSDARGLRDRGTANAPSAQRLLPDEDVEAYGQRAEASQVGR